MRGKSQATLELIDACIDLLEEIQPASVRAVCYKLFALGLIEDMSKVSTNRVGRILVKAREEGAIPWEYIADGTRTGVRRPQWKDPKAFLKAVRTQYARDRWEDQSYHVELWSEKSTVEGVLAPVWEDFGITFRSLHGFNSATVVKMIADESVASDKPFVALYVGDWDPSGMYMSEVDLPTRLDDYGGCVEIKRIALLEEDTSSLPSFSAHDKRGDSRYQYFLEKYGDRCWELDAMSPPLLRKRVQDCIMYHIDSDKWNRMKRLEQQEFNALQHYLDGRDFALTHR